MSWRCLAILTVLGLSISTPLRAGRCIDVSADEPIQLTGRLHHRSFPDKETDGGGSEPKTAPEAAYILRLVAPECFFGDEFLGGEVTISEVHLMVDVEENQHLFARLRELTGKNVTVIGRRALGAHSRHHRAPVLLVLDDAADTRTKELSAKQVVEAFYLALESGDGSEAAQYVIPAKRRSGPLSASALSGFYGNLRRPLKLLNVVDLGTGRYRATYRFETHGGARCNGSSIATTIAADGVNLISRIVAESGC